MNMKIQCTRGLLMLFAAAVLAAGLLALAGSKSAWAELSSGFEAAPNSPFAVGDAPTTVTNADFNGDGKMDLAAQNAGSNTVSVLLGNGDGSFQAKQDFGVGLVPTSVTSADFNDDTLADLAVANQNSNNVSVLLGKGDGTFQTKQDFTVGTNPSSVISAEFNGDGKTDLAVANYSSNTVSVLLGNGDGTFQTAQPYSVSVGGTPGPNQIITDDFDGDGDVDLATANVGSNTEIANFHGGVAVLLGNGDGTFQNASRVVRVYLPYSLSSADFDDDGDSDLVATSYGLTGGCCVYGEVKVVLGNGDGTFGAGQSFRVGSGHTGPSAVASADLDTDGREDLVVSNSASDDVSVMLGNGDGTFGVAQNFPAGDLPAFVISPDLDADGVADLAVANQDSNNVSVLLNTESQPSPPETTITKGPSGTVNSTSATFEFSSSEPGSTFQCALDVDDPSAYSPCTSPKTLPDVGQSLAEGSHTFYVKATGSGGTDPTPAKRMWKVDTTAPDTNIADKPNNPSNNGSPSFGFSGTDNVTSAANLAFECRIDGGAYTSCTSPKSYSNLGDGLHTFSVRAKDEAGNVDGNPASYTWKVDTTAPIISNVSPADQSQNVPLATNVEATFSEDMDASDTDRDPSTLTTSTFTLIKQGSSTPLGAQVSYDSATKKATLDPSSDLEATTTYTATIKGGSTGAEDLAGNALAQDYTWTFTTAPPAPPCTKTGTANAETISGTSGADVICAGGGNDTIKGLGGNDILKGQGGNDKLLGGVGDDTLDGDIGTDTASYSASLTTVNASLATNRSTGEGTDTFIGVENLLGSSKADTLTGSGANNTLTGGGGGDTERGGAGNDKVVGSGGADFLYGQDGADTVNSKDGVNGNDSLDGGGGTDTKVTDTTEKSIVGFP